MPIDLGLFDAGGSKGPTHPYEIFRKRPSGKNTIEDLWQGQREAIERWHNSEKNDVLISLNTGAGKSIIGSLIAQSLVNKGTQNVLYLCATKNLVDQTLSEAHRVGLDPTVYKDREFSNENFNFGSSFCITTYQSALHPFNKFRNDLKPGAIIFDDAHVAEPVIRQNFLVSINKPKDKELYKKVFQLFYDRLADYNLRESLNVVADASSTSGPLFMPPALTLELAESLERALLPLSQHSDFFTKAAYENLQGHLAFCTFVIGRNKIEIAPPFLPTMALPALGDQRVKRVYLSATMNNESDFARAFGRSPGDTIKPEVDAGNGERLVLFSKYFPGGELNEGLLNALKQKYRTIFSTPSYPIARKWAHDEDGLDSPFEETLAAFKESQAGLLFLVGRYDGIDFPNDVCRVMIAEGLPAGATYIERYCYEKLELENAYVGRIATRITQMFGRINRGRADYGVYILNGSAIREWVMRPKRMAYLPELLRRQIYLGERLLASQARAIPDDEVLGFIEKSIERDAAWVNFYGNNVTRDDVDPLDEEAATSEDSALSAACRAEVRFQSKIWQGNLEDAKQELANQLDDLVVADPRLAGWHAAWLGVIELSQRNTEAAADYFSYARARLQKNIPLPYLSGRPGGEGASKRVNNMYALLRTTLIAGKRGIERAKEHVAKLGDPHTGHKQAEEAVRVLGECFGFDARRPCTEFKQGPDCIWICEETGHVIIFDLKNEKNKTNAINKGDVAQAKVNIDWVKKKYPHLTVAGDRSHVVAWNGEMTDHAIFVDGVVPLTIEKMLTQSDRLFSTLEAALSQNVNARKAQLKDIEEGFGSISGLLESYVE